MVTVFKIMSYIWLTVISNSTKRPETIIFNVWRDFGRTGVKGVCYMTASNRFLSFVSKQVVDVPVNARRSQTAVTVIWTALITSAAPCGVAVHVYQCPVLMAPCFREHMANVWLRLKLIVNTVCVNFNL